LYILDSDYDAVVVMMFQQLIVNMKSFYLTAALCSLYLVQPFIENEHTHKPLLNWSACFNPLKTEGILSKLQISKSYILDFENIGTT
jgi:hypothetical protein